ncbi:MAG: S41 family peptidase [Bacteroidota bacterium]
MCRLSLVTLLLFSILVNSCKYPATEHQSGDCSPGITVTELLDQSEMLTEQEPDISFTQKLPPQLIKQDMLLLHHMLKEAHTGLYRYASTSQVDSLFDASLCIAADSMTYLEFIRQVARTFNTIACGHSGWGHSSAFRQFRTDSMKFFPLRMHVIGDQFFVKFNSAEDLYLQSFDEIREINGEAPSAIIRQLKQHMYKDGNSGGGGRSEIGTYFHMAYANFIDTPDSFRLRILRRVDREEEIVVLPALPLSTINDHLQERYPDELHSPAKESLRLEVDGQNGLAVCTIESFNTEYLKARGQHFESFIDSVFEEISSQQISSLILDLRGNTGGWTANGKYLFEHFINEPTGYISEVVFKQSDSFSFEPFIQHGPGIVDTFQLMPRADGLFEWTNYPSLQAIPQPGNRFSGKVCILTDDMTRSAAAVFSSLMQAHTGAIFVGQETGGAKVGQNGMVMGAQLPHTGVFVHFATARYTCNVPDSSGTRGVIPDHLVTSTIEDIRLGRDQQMEVAWNVMLGRNNR